MNALLRQRRFTCATWLWALALIYGLSAPSPLLALNSRNESIDSSDRLTLIYGQQPNQLVSVFHISPILLDDASAPQSSEILAPHGTRSIAFQYNVLIFTVPAHVPIRRRLEGWDSDRHDAGDRRQIADINLPQSSYCFHVLASNDEVIWNEAGDSVPFRVKPAFWQTMWFKILLVFVAIIAMWTAIYLRMVWAARQFRNRAACRMAERARIARELHDGFLQDIQGLFLRFKTISRGLSAEDPTRAELEQTLEQAQAVFDSGREMKDALCMSSPFGSINENLENFGSEQSTFYGVPFRIDTIGTMRILKSGTAEELCKIAREAISNAFRYAQANLIQVKLHYDTNSFRIVVLDDGVGILGRILDYGPRDGHWGLLRMRERAANIGATLRIDSDTATGTRVQIETRAWRAYESRSSRFGQWLRLAPNPASFDE